MRAVNMMLLNNAGYWNANLLPRHAVTEKRPKERELQDTVEISPQVALLSRAGLDIANSKIEFLDSRMDFNLEFKSSAFERLSANGYYAEERKELNLSLNFVFQKVEVVDGQAHKRIFEANLSFRASEVNTMSVSPFGKKEDIMQLVRRLIDGIADVARDDTKKLGGVILDPEDFKEIAAIDHGRLAKKLHLLAQWVMLYTNIIKTMKEGKEAEIVSLHPDRKKYSGIKIQETSMTINDFHLEIKDITKDYQASGKN